VVSYGPIHPWARRFGRPRRAVPGLATHGTSTRSSSPSHTRGGRRTPVATYSTSRRATAATRPRAGRFLPKPRRSGRRQGWSPPTGSTHVAPPAASDAVGGVPLVQGPEQPAENSYKPTRRTPGEEGLPPGRRDPTAPGRVQRRYRLISGPDAAGKPQPNGTTEMVIRCAAGDRTAGAARPLTHWPDATIVPNRIAPPKSHSIRRRPERRLRRRSAAGPTPMIRPTIGPPVFPGPYRRRTGHIL